MYIELIKEMSTPDHKLHNFLRKEVQEVRERESLREGI